MRDLYSNIDAAVSIIPVVQSANANGMAIDLKGFNRAAIMITTGAIVGAGEFSVKVQDSDNGTTFADAPAQYVDSNAPATLAADSTYKLGYRGHKRYIRAVLTKAGGTSITAGAIVVLADPSDAPVA